MSDTSGNPALDCWFLTGATASGKTSVGLALAQSLDAEIISLDSMAVYRGMNIGTAKPTPQQRRQVPHHLIDIVDPGGEFSVSQFVELSHERIAEIRGRGHNVLFVGGTPLYLKSMLRGLFEGPPADWEFREQIEEEIRRVGLQALRRRLEQVDPLSADKLHPNDKRRMIRALEVYKLTGEPISHLQMQFDEGHPAERCKVFALQWPRPELHARINARVDRMIAEGFLDEVRSLIEEYGELSRTASQAVGYCEAIEHLRGGRDMTETIELIKTRTRRFARHQETWFRSLSECRFIARDEQTAPQELARRIIAHAGGQAGP